MFFTHMQIQHAFSITEQPSFTGLAAHLTADTAPKARFLPTMIMVSISVAPLPFKYIYIFAHIINGLKVLSMQSRQPGMIEWENAEGRLRWKHGTTVLSAFLRQSSLGFFFFFSSSD